VTAADSSPPGSTPPPGAPAPVDGSGTARARCVLAPNPGPMTLNGTNTWLIAEPGSAVAMVVDPGPDDEAHLRRVGDLAAAAGQRIGRILLTHGHLDHSAGAARLASLTGAPVLAADPALRRSPGGRSGPGGSSTGEGLGPGDVLTDAGCELRVVASPGHTADSVCLLLSADDALLTGDTVLGRGTTVIAGDGNLADYLATLDRLRALADEQQLGTLLPGHGPLLADPAGVLDFYISHRQERLAEIRAALAAGDRTGEEIVARVYADVDRSLWPFARWSVRAQLDYLASCGELPPGISA
jgi:glyoxylase-like metal-dependent hydrolase (beta-lactamase superfamily II)